MCRCMRVCSTPPTMALSSSSASAALESTRVLEACLVRSHGTNIDIDINMSIAGPADTRKKGACLPRLGGRCIGPQASLSA
jgi:hypothetical protein